MKAITVEPKRAGTTRLEDVAEPDAGDGSVLVEAIAVGVCGTDAEIAEGKFGWAPRGKTRLVLGHESLGRVVDPGPSRLKIGDLVVGIVRRPDPVPCPNCAVGEWDMCRNGQYTERGIKEIDGFMSERWRIEPEYAMKVDPSLGLNGVLLEPATVVTKAWEQVVAVGKRAFWEPRTVLVTGAGPIGLLAALVGKQFGLEVHVFDRMESGLKPDLVRALGATYHSGSLKDIGFAPDVIVECTGVGHKAVVRALDAELKKRKCPTEITGIEVSGLPPLISVSDRMSKNHSAKYGDYLDDFLGDKAIAGMLNGRFSYHDYGSDLLKGQLVENREAVRKKFDQYPGWKPWMSEYCVLTGSEGKGGNRRDLTMNTALDVARIIHLDLTLVGVTAWQWWTAVSGVDYKDGLIFTDWKKPGDSESIIAAKLLWVLGNYSRFVRPGMRRVELRGTGHDVRGLMGSAYKDEKAQRVVVVYVNMGADAQTVQLDFGLGKRGWRLKSVTPYVTSHREGDELKTYPAATAGGPIGIPARSVTTLVAQFT